MAKNYHIIMKIEILSWIKEILDRGSIEELYTNRDKLASLGLVSKMLETVSSLEDFMLDPFCLERPMALKPLTSDNKRKKD
jgi:hypothetical protein